MVTYSQTLSAAKTSGPPSADSIELPAIRTATTRATMAQNSVVLNACLVSVARRRVALPRAPPERRVSAPVALCVAMRLNSFGCGWICAAEESRLRQGVTGRVFPCQNGSRQQVGASCPRPLVPYAGHAKPESAEELLRQPHGLEGFMALLVHAEALDVAGADCPGPRHASLHLDAIPPDQVHRPR